MRGKYIDRYRQIGRAIAHYRNLNGLSQEALAEKVGISKSYLSKIEAPNSQKPYSLDVLFGICDALDIDINNLFKQYENNN